MSPWLLCATAAAQVLGAVHSVERTPDELVWTTSFVTSGEAIALAVPLRGVEVRADEDGLRPVHDPSGALVALEAPGEGRHRVQLIQRLDGPLDQLMPPIASGEVVQKVQLGGLRFDPAPALGLEPHLGGHWSVPAVTREDRERLDVGYPDEGHGVALFVRGDDVARAGGLRGSVGWGGARRTSLIGALVAFAVALIGLVAGLRFFGRRARRAEVERYLVEELGLGDARP